MYKITKGKLMSHPLNSLTTCNYLLNVDFNKPTLSPDVDFKEPKASKSASDAQCSYATPLFVDESLKTMMKIVYYLVNNKPDAFFIFDPAAENNQCHIYSLMFVKIATIQIQVSKMFPEEVTELIQDYVSTDDRKFLYLSFLLSPAFRTNSKLLDQVIKKSLKEMEMPPPTSNFLSFLKDFSCKRTRDARLALNILFQNYMKQNIASLDSPYQEELQKLAKCNLLKNNLYTFPKFAGVAYFNKLVQEEKIPIFFKVKVMTQNGNGSFVFAINPSQNQQFPVIVYEIIVTDKSMTPDDCQAIAPKCYYHSLKNIHPSHDKNGQCSFCTSSTPIDVAPFQEKFQKALQNPSDMLLALGADFILEKQGEFYKFFSDEKCFPKLTQLFSKSVTNITSLCLSAKRPENFTAFHAYPDSTSQASKNILVMNDCYENHLNKRKLT
jgi:hypothetical protein